jgi:hypothetical protein
MALPKITSVKSWVAKDGSQVRLTLALSNGASVETQMTSDEFSELVRTLIHAHGARELREMQSEVRPSDDPIHLDMIGIGPAIGSSTDAVLILLAGALRLEFVLPLADPMEQLENLKTMTEPDPIVLVPSSPRDNRKTALLQRHRQPFPRRKIETDFHCALAPAFMQTSNFLTRDCGAAGATPARLLRQISAS